MRDIPDGGPEVLLLERAARGVLAGNHVFPGGVLEPSDFDSRMMALCTVDGSIDARLFLERDQALAYYSAACRETFEETGVLLARAHTGRRWHPCVDESRMLARSRAALREGKIAFVEVLAERGLRPGLEDLGYFAHWVTPAAIEKRYDTRFFFAECPQGVPIELDGDEIVAYRWIRPAAALDAQRTGQLAMVNATLKTLEWLKEFTTVGEARASLASRVVEPILPKALRQGAGFRVVNPWDPEYKELL